MSKELAKINIVEIDNIYPQRAGFIRWVKKQCIYIRVYAQGDYNYKYIKICLFNTQAFDKA